jgi:3-phenylpropionate/trans-cinnamate dioxygenase ferredoxin subunit
MKETHEFVSVANESDISEGQVCVVEAGGKRIALCKSDGTYYAIDDRCTHDNGPLGEGELVDGEIECPRHGARFDVHTGKAVCLPAVGAVATYAVQVREGKIFVSTTPNGPGAGCCGKE